MIAARQRGLYAHRSLPAGAAILTIEPAARPNDQVTGTLRGWNTATKVYAFGYSFAYTSGPNGTLFKTD